MNYLNKLTIILISYKSEKKINTFIKKIPKKIKVLIIENSGNVSLKKKLEKRYSNIKVFIKRNEGVSSALNFAVKKVKTDYFLQISPDISINYKDLKFFFDFAKKNSDNFSAIGPRFLNADKKSHKQIDKNLYSGSIKSIHGSCMFINKKKYKEIGGFDNNFFLYFEETDLIKRCLDNSKKVLMINNIKIAHKGRSSSSSKLDSVIEENRNWHYMWSKFYFFKKHYGYFFGFLKISKHLTSSLIKFLFFLLKGDLIKKRKYRARLSGCLNGLFLKKAWFRPKI